MKLLAILLWPLGFSYVPNESDSQNSKKTVLFTEGDYAIIHAKYKQLRTNGKDHQKAWAEIITTQKWDTATSVIALHGFEEYLQKNPVEVKPNTTDDNSTVIL